jgi:pSer/pThr/pTyr-binding forkhead associated (FHA) protein
MFADLPTAGSAETPVAPEPPELRSIDEVRASIKMPGQYVAYTKPDGEYAVLRLRTTTRIGRSDVAHVRFDDPTVSRRHALIVRRPGGYYILDDRSLNGVYVNDERVEWKLLCDGDDIVVGRHGLRFIDVGIRFRTTIERRDGALAVT